MRRATHETEWLISEDNALVGFSLGFDFCSEHEQGMPFLKSSLYIPNKDQPTGLVDRTMTKMGEGAIRLLEYKDAMRPRLTAEKHKIPHAILFMSSARYGREPETPKAYADYFRCELYEERPGSSSPPKNIATSWGSSDGFAIHVRGEENVARLKQLHAAFLANDIALIEGSFVGFLRKPMSIVIPSATPDVHKETLLATDLCNQRLENAAKKTGIHADLKKAGKGWHALSPGYRGGIESPENLEFFLNPRDQKIYAAGWYSEKELREWIEEKGPVADGILAKKALVERFGADARHDLVRRSNEINVNFNNLKEVWLDPEKTQPGYFVKWAFSNEVQYHDDYYSTEKINAIFDEAQTQSELRKDCDRSS